MTTAVSSREFKADWREDPSPGARDIIGAPIEHLELATILSATGSFAWKPASGQLVWSDETHRIFALDRGTKPTVDFVLSCTHADDRDSLRQLIDRATRETRDGISSIGS